MLTNIFVPTTGEFHLSFATDQPHIGYCPQVDSLDPLITVEDLLQIYAKLKGIPNDGVKDAVRKALSDMDLVSNRLLPSHRNINIAYIFFVDFFRKWMRFHGIATIWNVFCACKVNIVTG